ncbi:MAG: hypothetical protein GC147_00355 [Porphyrobacter sp.]|nr:hypothetical protein [Porphyrobacter sp.]
MINAVTYYITEDDYASFLRLMSARAMPRFALTVAGFVAIVSAAGFLLSEPYVSIGAVAGGLVAIGVTLIVGRNFTIPRNVEKVFSEYALIQEEMTLSVTSEKFSISQASGHVAMLWGKVAMWNENDRVLLIHPNRNLAYILPKQALGSERHEYIKQRLVENGLPHKGKLRK